VIIAMIAAAVILLSAMGYTAWSYWYVPEPEFILGTWQPAPEPMPELRLEMRFAPPAPITWRGMKITPRENIGFRKALAARKGGQ
jgi:hypothetical protein